MSARVTKEHIHILIIGLFALLLGASLSANDAPAHQEDIDWRVKALTEDVRAWRRDIHEHPELGNRETRTSALVAEHLRNLGFDEVRTGIAHTGVVGILRGGKPGKVVALRADMDALPVQERVDLPIASKVRTTFNNQEVGVMHACGHDVHTSVLMGTASVLAGMRDEIPGIYFFLGISPPDEKNPAPNHSPLFYVDEEALPIGVRAMSTMAMDYLTGG